MLVTLTILAAACLAIAMVATRMANLDRKARLRAERRALDEAESARRGRSILEASRILESSLDCDRTLADLARFLTDAFCQSAAAFVMEGSQFRRIAGAGSEQPAEQPAEQPMAALHQVQSGQAQGGAQIGAQNGAQNGAMTRVVRSGRSEVISLSDGSNSQYALIPLRTRAGAAGLFVLERDNDWNADDVRALEEIGRRAGAALERDKLYRSAQEASQLKDDFVAIVSHELRTPLTPILGAVYMLRAQPSPGKTFARALDLIERNARMQSRIVEDLLDASHIISGRLRLNRETVDLHSIVQDAVESARTASAGKNVEIAAQLHPLQGSVYGDPARLRQAAAILLANSLRFTPGGGRITVELEESGAEARLVVRDTGTGIGSEALPHISDRFRLGNPSKLRTHGSLGLQLAIVRHLVESHGGTVGASGAGQTGQETGQEEGCVFIVRLPLHVRAAAEEVRRAHAG